MFKIDKSRDDKQRDKNPISDCNFPRENPPDGQEKEGGEQFHAEIAECDLASASCAAAAKNEPAKQWHVLSPWNLFFARGTKRVPRFADGEIDREPVNADVQK